MEWLTKRASRGSSSLISKAKADAIVEALTAYREHPQLEPLRHYGTHGPQLGLDGTGWLAEGKTSRFWELIAVAKEEGSEVLEQFLSFSDERRDRFYESTSSFVSVVEQIIADTSGVLLESFKETRRFPSS
jgi:hypothetical protein